MLTYVLDAVPENLRDYSEQEPLKDARHVLIRAIRPDDKATLQDGMHRLSAESAYLRFLSRKLELSPEELTYFTEVDFEKHVALVAILTENGADHVVGVGRYIVCDQNPLMVAEAAFAVDDAHQGLGIGKALMRHLMRIARASHIAELRATVLAGNHKTLELLSRSGLTKTLARDGSIIEVSLLLGDDSSSCWRDK
jgi:GNAT superfamily N-acetyltransferase